jgi:valine--pyruvate aminotransferase
MRRIALPMCPEYAGYEGGALDGQILRAFAPVVQELSEHEFNYGMNLDADFAAGGTGAIVFSRPCNPTGKILSDAEVGVIANQAKAAGIPVFIDSAYGPPFPNMVFDEFAQMRPAFGGSIVHCMSLSKAGLPGERIGIAIGAPEFISPLRSFQSNVSLHSSRFGQVIAARAIASGELAHLSEFVIRPFYHSQMQFMKSALKQELGNLPWLLHESKGGLFAWLWMKDLPGGDLKLYEKLKANNLLVVPGAAFFPGFKEDWPHMRQCVRISLTAPKDEIEKGIKILGQVLKTIYDPAPSGRPEVRHQANAKPVKAIGD